MGAFGNSTARLIFSPCRFPGRKFRRPVAIAELKTIQVNKYETLVTILDRLRLEAPKELKRYHPTLGETEKLNNARSKAFIHLYLKVSFGLLEFLEREHYVTDGIYDGGIDGYYVNKENKIIYFIQSKFRASEANFERKKIQLEEILSMDIDRILSGEDIDEQGNSYNGKIKQLTREISELDGIARYSYQVILLANLDKIQESKLRQLTGGFSCAVFDHEKCYSKLVFQIISGTYFNAADLNINIDLSNKNAGSKISYTVQTKKSECEITVLFVPTIELGRIMYKYKNSILKYNPRSYLDFEGKKVNEAIKETIINRNTNEFALFNNGITMLSDETYINERIGQKNKAQLIVKNPQIINGGQTSFTLSRIYQEHMASDLESVFQNKEVLLKIITLIDRNSKNVDDGAKIELIEEISTATNQQTPVINADRHSNEKIHVKLQELLFDRYGLLYERKRGEFGDGVYNSYIQAHDIIERNLFFRIYYAANGQVLLSRQKKLFLKQDLTEEDLFQIDKFDNFYFGLLTFKAINNNLPANNKIQVSIAAKIYAFTKFYKRLTPDYYQTVIIEEVNAFELKWEKFLQNAAKTPNSEKKYKDKATGQIAVKPIFSQELWYGSDEFNSELLVYPGD